METLAAIAKSTASQIVMIRGGSNWALYHVENLVQIIGKNGQLSYRSLSYPSAMTVCQVAPMIFCSRILRLSTIAAVTLRFSHSPWPRCLGRPVEPEAKFFNDFSHARACAQGGVHSESAPAGVLHAKAVVADDEVAFVTSANLYRNIELGNP